MPYICITQICKKLSLFYNAILYLSKASDDRIIRLRKNNETGVDLSTFVQTEHNEQMTLPGVNVIRLHKKINEVGVDLSTFVLMEHNGQIIIPGVNVIILHKKINEVGVDLSTFVQDNA